MVKHRAIMITGVNTLSDKLKENVTMDLVKKVVEENTIEMKRKMKNNAKFKGHYIKVKGGKLKKIEPTGETRSSIEEKISRNGLTGVVSPKTEYAAYLEYGTRFMSAQPFVKPAYDSQKRIFLDDMKDLVN